MDHHVAPVAGGVADEAGDLTYVGRTDDVLTASDYRISPLEMGADCWGRTGARRR
jgi:acyl-coenzyme A synthetase/AMP-(fatty) acid ligase